MTPRPQETTDIHIRLLKCTLAIPECRAYWLHTDGTRRVTATQAFHEYWFGARSLDWTQELLTNMRARFDAFPTALAVLHRWPHMSPETRAAICHWHLQLSDPLYRRFTAEFLIQRRTGLRTTVTRDLTVTWIGLQTHDRWSLPTRIQLARKLLSAAQSAGLVTKSRDPRPLTFPRVPDDALVYLLYLLRETTFEGTLLHNPYLTSVGLIGTVVEHRLRRLFGLSFHRQGDLVDMDWQTADLRTWADAYLTTAEAHAGGAP